MPADRLALAVGVGCEDQLVVVFQRISNRFDVFFAVACNLPQHVKLIVGINRAVFGRQVAHVAVRGQNSVIIAQIFVDCFGFGRGFDNNNGHKFRHLTWMFWAVFAVSHVGGRIGLSMRRFRERRQIWL